MRGYTAALQKWAVVSASRIECCDETSRKTWKTIGLLRTEAKSFAGLSCATCLEKHRLWPAHEQRVRSNLGVHHLPLDYSLHSVKISKSKLPCHRRLRGDADVRRCVAHGRGRGAEPLSTSCAVYNGADSPQLRGSTGAIFSLKAHLSGCLHLQSD